MDISVADLLTVGLLEGLLSADNALVPRDPALVDGAFSIALIVVIFAIAFVYARTRGPARTADSLTDRAEEVLDNQSR